MAIGKNLVKLVGEIYSDYRYSHAYASETFYTVDVMVLRLSGTSDIIPVSVSDRLVDVNQNDEGRMVEIMGSYRSFNDYSGNKMKVQLLVLAENFGFMDHDCEAENDIHLEGYLVKKPVYRQTITDRRITDFLIAVNNRNGKTNYIPCICWNRTAAYVSKLGIGTALVVHGRIQSRDYIKKHDDGTSETKTTYEVSARWVEPWTED